jgi:hypothetical protein
MRTTALILAPFLLLLSQTKSSLSQDAAAVQAPTPAAPTATTTPSKTSSTIDTPLSTYTIEADTDDLQSAALDSWTNNASKPAQLTPAVNPLSFGTTLCTTTAMCSPKDTVCGTDGSGCMANSLTCAPPTACSIKRNLYIVHVVDWKTVLTDSGKSTVSCHVAFASSGWYIYKSNKKTGTYETIYPNKDKSFPDIYDADNGTMISVSRLTLVHKADGKIVDVCKGFEPPALADTLTITQTAPAWLAGIEALISGLTGPTIGPAANAHVFDAVHFTYAYKTQLQIQAFSSKPLSRPYSIADSAAASGSSGAGPGNCNNMTAAAKCTFTNNFSVAQRAFVSFGILIVPHGPKETTYTTASDGTVSSSTTTHNAFYAVIDGTPFAGPCPMWKCPYLQAGFPLTGSALRLPYVGAAWPIWFSWFRNNLPLSVFLGSGFMKHEDPTGKEKYSGKWMYGVEVPIASFSKAISQVTGNKKSK